VVSDLNVRLVVLSVGFVLREIRFHLPDLLKAPIGDMNPVLIGDCFGNIDGQRDALLRHEWHDNRLRS
jgi:hypothetical protein